MASRIPTMVLSVLRLGFVGVLVWGWWVAVAPPTPSGLWFMHADKLKHAVAFAGFAFWACAADLRPRMLWALVLLAYGVAIEWAQAHVPGRDASWADAAADAIGIALGLWAAGLLERILPPVQNGR